MGVTLLRSLISKDDEAVSHLYPPVQSGVLQPLAKQGAGGAGQGLVGGHHHRSDPEPDQQLAGDHHHQRHSYPGPCWRNSGRRRNNYSSSCTECKPDPDPDGPAVPHHLHHHHYCSSHHHHYCSHHHYCCSHHHYCCSHHHQVWRTLWWRPSLLIGYFYW